MNTNDGGEKNETDNDFSPIVFTWTVAIGLRVGFYIVIFTAAILGNVLVIVTLTQNKRMRTVTNTFLLNLAISDLLLGVFCMPFTLVGSLLRNFIFGEVMCRLIPYLQAVSVSVSVWTLVSISLERYFAICRPLKSRQWQTTSHACKIIMLVWTGSFLAMLPIAVLSKLLEVKSSGRYKCRELWPQKVPEQLFNLYLVVILLIIPLVVMSVAYIIIVRRLFLGLQTCDEEFDLNPLGNGRQVNLATDEQNERTYNSFIVHTRTNIQRHLVVKGTLKKSYAAKKRVIRMLFVVMLEFFICWTPLYVINTWSVFDPITVYGKLGGTGFSAIQLLAYISCCCNPMTYCFMHKKYRKAFLTAVGCKKRRSRRSYRWSDRSATANSLYSCRNTHSATAGVAADGSSNQI
ncbi:cholecystokinin receptor-like [Tachypleus tridentatus]|uniref:cholecystokinin receptor-like n=1 Tax=Tachypleus tridentatus TaxID=6853 RepID=UPI003FD28F5C